MIYGNWHFPLKCILFEHWNLNFDHRLIGQFPPSPCFRYLMHSHAVRLLPMVRFTSCLHKTEQRWLLGRKHMRRVTRYTQEYPNRSTGRHEFTYNLKAISVRTIHASHHKWAGPCQQNKVTTGLTRITVKVTVTNWSSLQAPLSIFLCCWEMVFCIRSCNSINCWFTAKKSNAYENSNQPKIPTARIGYLCWQRGSRVLLHVAL